MKIQCKNLFIALSILVASHAFAGIDDRNAKYRIEMKNTTSTQWLSPCLCVLHDKKTRFFDFSQAASAGQSVFAEDGFNALWAAELADNDSVYSVLRCDAGLTPPGATRIEEISGPRRARLTCAAMPVTTNDVLTTIASVKLPKRIGRTRSYEGLDWDIGSENNNYSGQFMPLDSANLIAESNSNPVTIADNVLFYNNERPAGVPAVLSFFSRDFFNAEGLTAEGSMSLFYYEGSAAFPAEEYGWEYSASSFSVTRIK